MASKINISYRKCFLVTTLKFGSIFFLLLLLFRSIFFFVRKMSVSVCFRFLFLLLSFHFRFDGLINLRGTKSDRNNGNTRSVNNKLKSARQSVQYYRQLSIFTVIYRLPIVFKQLNLLWFKNCAKTGLISLSEHFIGIYETSLVFGWIQQV